MGCPKCNTNRKPEYRIVSATIYKGGKKVFIKYPQNELSHQFIKDIVKREITAQKGFAHQAQVVRSRIVDGILIYPYIPFPNLETLIDEKLSTKDFQGAHHLLKSYVLFLRNLAQSKMKPLQFAKEFGLRRESVTKELNSLSFGPIDCIPSNILVSKTQWYVVDHEWTYDFPVPVDYVIFRGIYSLVLSLQSKIQSHTSADFPVSRFEGYGKNQTFIPYDWLQFFKEMEIPIKDLYFLEYLFQKKIQIYSKLGILRLVAKPKKLEKIPQPSMLVRTLVPVVSKLQKWLLRLKGTEK